MEVVQVLCMNGGLGETSYANNSLVHRKVISMTKPIIEEAITQVYSSVDAISNRFCIAELGCSSGPNSLVVAAELISTVHQLSRSHGLQLPEFQILLNDLPGNDFNSIFHSFLPQFRSQLNKQMGSNLAPCFVYGVPGSFYGRLFAANSLHFVHSSYSLMWLSKVPEGMEKCNKEEIYIGSRSPVLVINAYYNQFRVDFDTFLKWRSEEVVGGGAMVLTILGRRSDNAASKECCYIWELLALSLKEMVSEGGIEEEKLHSFNIPQYMPSPAEVKRSVEMEGSFAISRLETSEIRWADCGSSCGGEDVAKCMRSVAEPMLVEHFGETIIDELFGKYERCLTDCMSKEEMKFINVTVSLIRRG
ncbi:S-adenosyl-L-methionine:benzoic acid/salicylic acid carboxyl methyltransferase 3-like isoform X2 [Salvia hispanica]|uniref:S-adenosyl-L-methionine:benzoic acid/salicylic acid carboxyl methyltransferase 3-like isoform X2 n=1 Tax=Salvia hispanica TaxID=49212 RepID=UPI002009C1C9|nr:S-adenosyl-L-methionine:benzoic acid/salicylic acid carboxyl methyltransferase 3-like isoform X2 [Salvia hispanica]